MKLNSILLLMVLSFAWTGPTFGQNDAKPNIVFIFSDDHAVNAISAYGGRLAEVAPTPNIDYGPTFLEMAGLNSPAQVQGKSIVPILKDSNAKVRDTLYYAYYELGEHAVPQHFGVRNDRYKLFHIPWTKEWQMFDLEEDSQVMTNIYGNDNYADIRQHLRGEYTRLREEFDAPTYEKYAPKK